MSNPPTPAKPQSQSGDPARVGGKPRRWVALDWGPPWIGPIYHRAQIDLLWLLVAIVLIANGFVFFGWRGLLSACTAALATLMTYTIVSAITRVIRPERPNDSTMHALVLGLLLGSSMPPACSGVTPWIAGIVLGILANLIGRSHHVRVHPIAATMLAVWVINMAWGHGSHGERWTEIVRSPQAVLRAERILIGDVQHVAQDSDHQPWWHKRERLTGDALPRSNPYAVLIREQKSLLQDQTRLGVMLSDGRLRPIGELVLGAVPGTFGGSSRALLIVVGLYVMYRRLAWWPMAVATLGAAVMTLGVMPMIDQQQFTLIGWRLAGLGPAVAVTYIAYTVLASPLALVVLILAPHSAPLSPRGRLWYGTTIGCVTILCQWFLTTTLAPFLALSIASAISNPLDALHKNRFLNM